MKSRTPKRAKKLKTYKVELLAEHSWVNGKQIREPQTHYIDGYNAELVEFDTTYVVQIWDVDESILFMAQSSAPITCKAVDKKAAAPITLLGAKSAKV